MRFSTRARVALIFAVVILAVETLVTLYYAQLGWGRLRSEMMISGTITTIVCLPVATYVMKQYEKLQQMAAELAHLASVDRMTDLLNRQTFLERLDTLVTGTSPTASAGVFAYIDADYFKALNDRFGHAIGDRVIVLLATQIKEAARDGDLTARLGGEEFAMFMRGANLTRATMVADRLRRDVELSGIRLGVVGLSLSVSIGLAVHKPGTAALATMQEADRNMYAAKDGGRNAVVSELRRNRVA
ncbi:GGDEF domain-containing protein [Mesorhizobium sp. NBSH29]|uniref:GGDEF domain-containing protein n=1 Tax=Mesorhizobium sp. NBSH29 TaxID=2654249 RepID=UPI0018968A60|nr:GGDEF domain-containing protein [Mesorhizobium sp. NBSH29]